MKLYVLSNLWRLSMVQAFFTTLQNIRFRWLANAWLRYGTNRWRVKPRHRAKADSSRVSIVNKQISERRAPSKEGDGGFTLNHRRLGPKEALSESQLFASEHSKRAKGVL